MSSYGFDTHEHCTSPVFEYPYNISSGKWYNWVITYDSTGHKMFLNGTLLGTNSVIINNTYVLNRDLAIGVDVSYLGYAPYTDANVGWFNGKIDDVMFYNRTLTDTEIMQLYNLNSALSLKWSTGATTKSITVKPSQTTTYNVVGTNNYGCSNIDSVVVIVNTSVQPAYAGPDQFNVNGISTTLAANTPEEGTGSWSIINGNGGKITDTLNPQSTFTGNSDSTYLLLWTITNSCGSSSDTVSISFKNGTAPSVYIIPEGLLIDVKVILSTLGL